MKVEDGVFINGRAQIIEMLQFMTAAERSILINNVKSRNPQLASEMLEHSFSFENIEKLTDSNFQMSFQYVQAEIWGIALKGTSEEFQRKILSLAPRAYAENAFKILKASIQHESRDVKRAQKKIIDLFMALAKKGQVRL